MGTRNGIVLRVHRELDPESPLFNALTSGIFSERDEYDEYEYGSKPGSFYYEICYWRNCFNINDILFSNHVPSEADSHGVYALNPKELESIRDDIYYTICDGEEGWNSSYTLCDFEEAVPTLAWDIVRISELIRYLKENAGQCEVFFYDSY